MDSKRYKSICEQPNVFRLQDLKETLDVLHKVSMPEQKQYWAKSGKATFASRQPLNRLHCFRIII